MEDLASLGGARAEEAEEGLELKTPTQEDQAGLASCSTSDGSSGYGSQGSGQMETDGAPRPPLLRPYSFTSGVPPGAPHAPGVVGRGPVLRRSSSQASRPAPPARVEEDVEVAREVGEQGSNSTTPHGSMEFLPPPPPHLLCSDDEEEGGGAKLSVADSVRKLSLQQGRGPSPGALRRVHSLSAPPGHHPDRALIMKRLDAALASPRGRGGSPSPQDQIYAPVAALQQKIQQQQQARLQHHGQETGLGHPPGPRVQEQQDQGARARAQEQPYQDQGPIYASSTLQQQQGSPEASSEYGFGMQFQQRQHLQQRGSFQPQQKQQQLQQQYQEQQQFQQQQQQQYHQQQFQEQHRQHQRNQQQQGGYSNTTNSHTINSS